MLARVLDLVLVGLVVAPTVPAGPAAPAAPADYSRDVKPLLARRCHRCHGAAKQKSGLRLDTAAQAVAGGNRGPAIVPGKSGESLIIDAVAGRRDAPAMPPEGPRLASEEIALLERWIDEGAKAPPNEPAEPAPPTAGGHWAFRPVVRPPVPRVKDEAWVRNPMDAFILARLEKEGFSPSPEAAPAALMRRLSFDLLGLPPSPDEVDAFLADARPDAYEQLVERLLASPHHGERWGRHWLDLARYADSNGYTIDGSRSIWKYRDWVIDAINRDMPFDRFAVEQIAGDMLPGPTTDQVIATGFHRNTLRNEEGGTDQEQFRVEAVADRVSTTATVFLGFTMGCARCHDHKYDPISQREYYEFFALFNNADEPAIQVPTGQQARELPLLSTELAAAEKLLADNENAVTQRQAIWERDLAERPEKVRELPEAVRKLFSRPAAERSEVEKKAIAAYYRSIDKDRVPLAQRVADLKKREEQLRGSITTSLVMAERTEARETRIHIRGDFLRLGARVEGAVPGVLPRLEASAPDGRSTRLDLARWLVDLRNPLTPRVTANRVWQAYFGQGIVATENDFGTQGAPPAHPELLDWLASELVAGGWSMKAMHRLIVTSATYRQSSMARPDLREADPYNKLLGRQSRLRLEAEAVRDAALAASGLLSREVGGPGVYPPQPQGIYRFTQTAKFWKESEGPDRYRRGMYTYFWRSSPHPLLTTFDAPDATLACTRRVRSNTPLQALTLANDAAFFEMAQALAVRMMREAPGADGERIRHAFRACLSRSPGEWETRRLSEFLAEQRKHFAAAPRDAEAAAPPGRPVGVSPVEGAAWTAVARVMLNLDELITRE